VCGRRALNLLRAQKWLVPPSFETRLFPWHTISTSHSTHTVYKVRLSIVFSDLMPFCSVAPWIRLIRVFHHSLSHTVTFFLNNLKRTVLGTCSGMHTLLYLYRFCTEGLSIFPLLISVSVMVTRHVVVHVNRNVASPNTAMAERFWT